MTVDAEVLVAARRVRDWSVQLNPFSDLSGWCARASGELFRLLEAQGRTPELHLWTWDRDASAHVFVVCDDHVVDVTATQFREFRCQPIVIMHQRESQAYEFYRSVDQFHSVRELIRYQRLARWPLDQMAFERPRLR